MRLLFLLWGLAACSISSNNPAIVQHMDAMKRAYDAAEAAPTLDEFALRYGEFAAAARAGSQETYRGPENLAGSWSEGEQALVEALAKVEAALAAADLDGAKAALLEIDQLRKKYHVALGV